MCGLVAGWVGLQCMWVHVCTVHELLFVLCLLSNSVFACNIPHSIRLQTGEAEKKPQQITQKARQREVKWSVFSVMGQRMVSQGAAAETVFSVFNHQSSFHSSISNHSQVAPLSLLPTSGSKHIRTNYPILVPTLSSWFGWRKRRFKKKNKKIKNETKKGKTLRRLDQRSITEP